MPYLTQFSDRQRQQGGGGQTALRHMYAAGLAEMGSGPHQVGGDGRPEGEESQLPQHERKAQESRTTSLEDSLDGTVVATLQVRATAGTQHHTARWPHLPAGSAAIDSLQQHTVGVLHCCVSVCSWSNEVSLGEVVTYSLFSC